MTHASKSETSTSITHLIMNTLELDPPNRLPIRIEAAPAFG